MPVHAVITAAGSSRRMGGLDKLLLPLRGRPLLTRTVEPFLDYPNLGTVVVAVNRERVEEFRELFELHFSTRDRVVVTSGGAHRQESILFALRRLAEVVPPGEDQTVMIHDGARPFVTHQLFDKLLLELPNFDGVVPTLPVRDTVKVVEGRRVIGTQDRETLRLVQTPQLFRLNGILSMHERAHDEGFVGTDDASLLEHFGGRVGWVEGPAFNLKVTVPDDLQLLEPLFASRSGAATR